MKNILLIGLLIGTSLITQAQQGNFRNMSVEERAKVQTEQMNANLELDTIVAVKVYDINLKYSQQLEESRQNTASRYEMMKVMEKTKNARKKERKAILTKSQYKKYMRQQQEMQNQRQQRMGQGMGQN